MQAATYLPARKGGRHLKDENNMTYALNKRRDNKTYYVCTEKKSLNCPATAVVENMTERIIKLYNYPNQFGMFNKNIISSKNFVKPY